MHAKITKGSKRKLQDKLGNPLQYMKIKMQHTKAYRMPRKQYLQDNLQQPTPIKRYKDFKSITQLKTLGKKLNLKQMGKGKLRTKKSYNNQDLVQA